ncbi:MAG: sigma-70 family RNA polymerase sigma factor [bacterium]|nr:sigma-70 family RNA polymerase sigma factor [bacterium]
MKLRIRYENELQYLELNAEDTERLWISLSLEGEGLSQAERENRIEEFFEEQFNRPEYNNWHKETRRIGNSKARPKEDNGEVEVSEPLMSEVIDDRIFMQDEIRRDEQEEYEEVCDRVRTILAKKPHWAEAFIAVRIDGVSVNDHAASIGVKDASIVSKWLSRAEKKLREKYRNRQI